MKAAVADLLANATALADDILGPDEAIRLLLQAASDIAIVEGWDAARFGMEAARVHLEVPPLEPPAKES